MCHMKKIVEKKPLFIYIAVLSLSLNRLWLLIKYCHTSPVTLVLLTQVETSSLITSRSGKTEAVWKDGLKTVTEEVKGAVTSIWTTPI